MTARSTTTATSAAASSGSSSSQSRSGKRQRSAPTISQLLAKLDNACQHFWSSIFSQEELADAISEKLIELNHLAYRSDEKKNQMASHYGLNVILKVMTTFLTEPTVQSTACALLSTLMEDRSSVSNDGLDTTVHYQSSEKSQQRRRRRRRVAAVGTLLTVLNSMRFHHQNDNTGTKETMRAQNSACRVLLCLLVNDPVQAKRFVKQGGINVAETMLRNYKGYVDVQRNGCVVLRELTAYLLSDSSAESPFILTTQQRTHLVTILLTTMVSHRFDDEVQRICSQSLSNLLARRMGHTQVKGEMMMTNEATATVLTVLGERMMKEQCFSAMLTAMQEFPNNLELLSSASGVLSSLLYAGRAMRKEQVRTVIKVVINAMKSASSRDDNDWSLLLQHGSDMLLCLSQDSSNRRVLRKRGAVSVLMGILNEAPMRGWDITLQRSAGVALFYLAETESFCEHQHASSRSLRHGGEGSGRNSLLVGLDDDDDDEYRMALNERAEKLCQLRHAHNDDESTVPETTKSLDASLGGVERRRSSLISTGSEYSIKLGGLVRRVSLLSCGLDFQQSSMDLPVMIDIDSFNL